MRGRVWLMMLSLMLATPAFADSPAGVIELPAGVPKALVDRIRAYDAAIKKRDTAALEDFWTDDYVFVSPRGERFTKKERLHNIVSGTTGLDAAAVQTEGAFRYGDTMLTVSHITLHGRYGGKPVSGEHRMIAVWVEQQGRWRLAANQLTPIAGKSKGSK
jgi:ketosteroid isomerase-like protein